MAWPDSLIRLTAVGQHLPTGTASDCPHCQHYDALAAANQGNPRVLNGVDQLRAEHQSRPGECHDPMRGAVLMTQLDPPLPGDCSTCHFLDRWAAEAWVSDESGVYQDGSALVDVRIERRKHRATGECVRPLVMWIEEA
jgi:hypothetical protein